MPWPVYTERFTFTTVTGAWTYWTVPAGKRAIVKNIASISSSDTGLKVHVVLANVYVAAQLFPAAYVAAPLDVLAVGYAGEVLRIFMEGAGGSCCVTGWLLDDPAGGAGAVAELEDPPGWPPPDPAWAGLPEPST